jgi:hypothetical protein
MVSGSGALAAQSVYPALVFVTNEIAAINQAVADGTLITSGQFSVFDPVQGTAATYSVVAGGLSADESATVFQAMLTILQNRQTALSAQLGSVS